MEFDANDIQANILKSHGRTHACFIFCRFTYSKRPQEIRQVIQEFSNNLLTSYATQCEDTKIYNNFRYSLVTQQEGEKKITEQACSSNNITGLYLTSKGYRKMGILYKHTPPENLFHEGMGQLISKNKLGDYELESELSNDLNKKVRRAFIGPPRFDCVILVANSDKKTLEKKKTEILELYLNKIIEHENNSPFIQYTTTLRNKHHNPIEHFGYADGFSTPTDEKVLAQMGLVREPGREKSFGSYVVFRKIKQNIPAFNRVIDDLRNKLDNKSRKYAKAVLMGRFPNGTPLACSGREIPGWNASMEENFKNYGKDALGYKCPLHAHIRAVNARISNESGEIPIPQIIRRSMTFDEGKDNKGLYFISYQSSIENNFIPLFTKMGVKKEGATNENFRIIDAITYRRRNLANQTPCTAEEAQSDPFCLSYAKKYGDASISVTQRIGVHGENLTTFLGGDYFFAPSLSFLKNLDEFAEQE